MIEMESPGYLDDDPDSLLSMSERLLALHTWMGGRLRGIVYMFY